MNTYFVCKGNFWVTLNSSCYYIPHTTIHTCRATMCLILYKHPHVAGLRLRDTELQPNIALRSLIQEAITRITKTLHWGDCAREREREREHRVKLFNLFLMSRLCTVSCLMQTSFNPHSNSSLTENEVPLLDTLCTLVLEISRWGKCSKLSSVCFISLIPIFSHMGSFFFF